MKSFYKLFALILTLALILGMTACGSAPQANQKITFALDWTPNTNHTGLYVALAEGYFKEAGLDVEILQAPENGAEVLVGAGDAQFGISFQDSLAPALIGENPLPITAVAAVIQHNTSGILSRKGEGMHAPKGLEGKKYATWDMAVEKATIQQVMQADGGDFSKVQLIPSTVTDEVSALQSRSVDAIWVFYAWGGMACQVAGLETDYFEFADIDPVFDFYTPVIVANNDFLKENPDTAKAFLAAVTKGYQFSVEHPRKAADILMEAAPELKSNASLIYQSQEYLAKEYQADNPRFGEFDRERWAAFFTWLNQHQLLEETIDPYAGFTNDYLPKS